MTTETKPVRHELGIAEALDGLAKVSERLYGYGLDRKLHHLVKLRASQINGCAFCVKMHLREAREDGETEERLDRLVVWRHVRDFSDDERAALDWVEALTQLDPRSDLGAMRARLRAHFSDTQISVLTVVTGEINLWNRLAISNH